MEEMLNRMTPEERAEFLRKLCSEILEENIEAFRELAK